MTMFIHFSCLCPLGLTIKLNFYISKVAYYPFRQLSHGLVIFCFKGNRENFL